MSVLTVAVFREHFETDVSDDAIQRVIDAIESELSIATGGAIPDPMTLNIGGPVTINLLGSRMRRIFVPYKIASVASIYQTYFDNGWDADYELVDPRYYRVENNGYSILMLGYYHWQAFIRVTYSPVSLAEYAPQVLLATIDLVKYELQYNGLSEEHVGDFMYMLDGRGKSIDRRAATKLRIVRLVRQNSGIVGV